MAIGWLAVLKIIPWADVISNAPVVADGAKKLWNAVAKKPALADLTADSDPVLSSEGLAISAVAERIAKLETAVSDLHGQMIASSELIKALAEQNTQLINRVETSRLRMRWLAALTVITTLIALGLLFAGAP